MYIHIHTVLGAVTLCTVCICVCVFVGQKLNLCQPEHDRSTPTASTAAHTFMTGSYCPLGWTSTTQDSYIVIHGSTNEQLKQYVILYIVYSVENMNSVLLYGEFMLYIYTQIHRRMNVHKHTSFMLFFCSIT